MHKSIAITGGGPGELSAVIRYAELGRGAVFHEKGQMGGGITCRRGFA